MAAKDRIALYLDVTTETSQYGADRYFTVTARVEAAEVSDRYSILNEPEGRIRVSAQQDGRRAIENDPAYGALGKLYGWTLTFSVPYNRAGGATLPEARQAVATLGRIERGLDKLAERLGPADTFAQYLARIGTLIDAKGYTVDGSRGWRGPFMNAADMADALRKAEADWRETFVPKPEPEAEAV